MSSEEEARVPIDALLAKVGWEVVSVDNANIRGAQAIARAHPKASAPIK